MSLLASGIFGNSGKLSKDFLCWLLQKPRGPGTCGGGYLPAAPVPRVPHIPVGSSSSCPARAEGLWSRSSAGLLNCRSCCAVSALTSLRTLLWAWGPLTLKSSTQSHCHGVPAQDRPVLASLRAVVPHSSWTGAAAGVQGVPSLAYLCPGLGCCHSGGSGRPRPRGARGAWGCRR